MRLSGSSTLDAVATLFQPSSFPEETAVANSKIITGTLTPWNDARRIPAMLFVWQPNHGYTGQLAVEIHCVGSQPILDAVVNALCRTKFVRLATPGEFTLRAFLAGRIDLTQAEAVLEVIETSSPRQLDVALDQLAGGLSKPLRHLRELLLELLSHLEAGLDFADEEIQFVTPQQVRQSLTATRRRIDSLLTRMSERGDEKPIPTFAIVGPPNAGKSTIFNWLTAGNNALVSSIAGTTRDYLESNVAVAGFRFKLIDTAGLDPNIGDVTEVGQTSQRFSNTICENADFLIFCVESGVPASPFVLEQIEKYRHKSIILQTKSDCQDDGLFHRLPSAVCCLVSAQTGVGKDELLAAIVAKIESVQGGTDVVSTTIVRCKQSVGQTSDAVSRALSLIGDGDTAFDESLVAGELRIALNELGHILGTFYTDEMLDKIFSRFCIGK